ncbi:MAG: formyltransferase family protein [Patescibacteria group bacterium]
MKILFLGGNLASDLAEWLGSQGEEVVYREDKISIEETKEINPDFIISYNYRYIIPKEMISLVSGKAINPHISYLPFNKGYHPNIWSFLDNTPKGVTIHYIDEGIDTGDIIVQKEIPIDESRETLKSSYEILQREIQKLFKENWSKMRKQEITPRPQPEGGSIHYRKEMVKFERFIVENGWDTPIADLKKRYNACSE